MEICKYGRELSVAKLTFKERFEYSRVDELTEIITTSLSALMEVAQQEINNNNEFQDSDSHSLQKLTLFHICTICTY